MTREPLLALQRATGNRAVGQLISRQVADPNVRDALMAQARAQIRTALDMIPGLLPLASQLHGETGVPGTGSSGVAAATLYSQLVNVGNLLDTGIRLYEQGGGRLGDIEHLLKVRAHLSTAAFFTQVAMGGQAMAMAPQIMQHLQMAMVERAQYEAEEAMRLAMAQFAEQGPQTQEQAIREHIEDQLLRARYLLPFGTQPIAVR